MFEEKQFNEFAKMMNDALVEKKDVYGDSWKNMTLEHLEQRITAKMTEFKLTKNPKKLISVANLAMMLYVRGNKNE